jgi:hypothetical protein
MKSSRIVWEADVDAKDLRADLCLESVGFLFL